MRQIEIQFRCFYVHYVSQDTGGKEEFGRTWDMSGVGAGGRLAVGSD